MPDDEFEIDHDPAPPPRHGDEDGGRGAARHRIRHQPTWVDLQVRRAIERGDFDELPGRGRPIEGLGAEHDPDWWLKGLVERERIVVLPASVQLRKDDAALDGRLDALHSESEARREVEEFNARVLRARYRLPEGPPLITMPRDVEATLAAWRERRAAQARARQEARAVATPPPPPRTGWRRWRRRHP